MSLLHDIKQYIKLIGRMSDVNDIIGQMFQGIEDDDVELGERVEEEPRAIEGGATKSRLLNPTSAVDTPAGVGESRQTSQLEPEEKEDDEEDDEGEEEEEQVEDQGYWDEEDEIEHYLQEREQKHSRSIDAADEEEGMPLELVAGDGTTRGEMDAETQRLLREVATRDRLGKGQKIEIKPLTGIVNALRKKREEVAARAVQLRAPEAPKFDDILSVVGEDVPLINEKTSGGEMKNVMVTPTKPPTDDPEDDLEVVSDEERAEGEFKLIDVPKSTPTKPSPLTFNPYNNSDELDDFEDEEVLLEDGAEYESDSESEHSWAIKNDGGNEEGGEEEESPSSPASNIEVNQNNKENKVNADVNAIDMLMENMNEKMAAERPSAPAEKTAVFRADEAQKKGFIDAEAELSDEEGLPFGASDDEEDEDDDLDNNGELADLIADGNTSQRDHNAAASLHHHWERQQDAKQLQEIVRGLEDGFHRRKHGAVDDFDGDLNGRLRRARHGDDDDDLGLGLDVSWPVMFGKPSIDDNGEECEDEAMLKKAQERKLVESQVCCHSSGWQCH